MLVYGSLKYISMENKLIVGEDFHSLISALFSTQQHHEHHNNPAIFERPAPSRLVRPMTTRTPPRRAGDDEEQSGFFGFFRSSPKPGVEMNQYGSGGSGVTPSVKPPKTPADYENSNYVAVPSMDIEQTGDNLGID